MRLRIDLSLKEPGSPGNRELRHVLAECVACAGLLELHFLPGVTDQPLALGDRGDPRLVDDLVRAAVRLRRRS